jgi:hypothetical protein
MEGCHGVVKIVISVTHNVLARAIFGVVFGIPAPERCLNQGVDHILMRLPPNVGTLILAQ